MIFRDCRALLLFWRGLRVEGVQHASFAGAYTPWNSWMVIPPEKECCRKRKRNHKKNAVNPPFQTLKEVMVAQLTLGLKISFINWISFVALFFFHVLLEWCLVFCFHPSAATHICQTKCVDWISRNGENRHLVCQTAFIHGLWQIMKSYIPSIATKGLDVSNFFQQIGMLKPTWKSRSIIATHLPTRRDNTSSIPSYPQVRWLRVPQLPVFLTCHRGQRCFLCSQQPRTGKGHCTERTANLTMAKRGHVWMCQEVSLQRLVSGLFIYNPKEYPMYK